MAKNNIDFEKLNKQAQTQNREPDPSTTLDEDDALPPLGASPAKLDKAQILAELIADLRKGGVGPEIVPDNATEGEIATYLGKLKLPGGKRIVDHIEGGFLTRDELDNLKKGTTEKVAGHVANLTKAATNGGKAAADTLASAGLPVPDIAPRGESKSSKEAGFKTAKLAAEKETAGARQFERDFARPRGFKSLYAVVDAAKAKGADPKTLDTLIQLFRAKDPKATELADQLLAAGPAAAKTTPKVDTTAATARQYQSTINKKTAGAYTENIAGRARNDAAAQQLEQALAAHEGASKLAGLQAQQTGNQAYLDALARIASPNPTPTPSEGPSPEYMAKVASNPGMPPFPEGRPVQQATVARPVPPELSPAPTGELPEAVARVAAPAGISASELGGQFGAFPKGAEALAAAVGKDAGKKAKPGFLNDLKRVFGILGEPGETRSGLLKDTAIDLAKYGVPYELMSLGHDVLGGYAAEQHANRVAPISSSATILDDIKNAEVLARQNARNQAGSTAFNATLRELLQPQLVGSEVLL